MRLRGTLFFYQNKQNKHVSLYILYTMDQFCLLMDLEEGILPNHFVRAVNATVNQMDDAIFDAAYPGGRRRQLSP
jgi:transposase